MAVLRDDEASVRSLIASGASPLDARSKGRFTALHFAAFFDRPRLVRALLEAGASPGPKNEWRYTARGGAAAAAPVRPFDGDGPTGIVASSACGPSACPGPKPRPVS